MKTPNNSSLYSFLFKTLTLVALVAPAHAQNTEDEAHMDSLIEALQVQQEQVKEKAAPLEAEVESIKTEQEKLKARLSVVETERTAVLADISLTLDLRSIEVLFQQKHGDCKITKGAIDGEFFVEKRDQKLRFLIAPEEHAKHPVAKLTNGSENPIIEFEQPGWSDKDAKKDYPFVGLVRMDKKSKRIIRSTFRGESVENRFLGGFGRPALPPETDITCVLL